MARRGEVLRAAGQIGLAAMVGGIGVTHLTTKREEFQAQVPDWIPLDKDFVVVTSGIVELAIGSALLATWRQPARGALGGLTAAFFVAVFPGNITQFVNHTDALGLDSDFKRGARLAFEPILLAWAIGTTDARRVYRSR